MDGDSPRWKPFETTSSVRYPFGRNMRREFPETHYLVVSVLFICQKILKEYRSDLDMLEPALMAMPEYPMLQRSLDVEAALSAVQMCLDVFPMADNIVSPSWKLNPNIPPGPQEPAVAPAPAPGGAVSRDAHGCVSQASIAATDSISTVTAATPQQTPSSAQIAHPPPPSGLCVPRPSDQALQLDQDSRHIIRDIDSIHLTPPRPASSSSTAVSMRPASQDIRRSRRTPSLAATFPPDILHLILKRFAPDGLRPHSANIVFKHHQFNLTNCCLVNRHWNQVATPILWAVPVLWSPENLEKFSLRCIWYQANEKLRRRHHQNGLPRAHGAPVSLYAPRHDPSGSVALGVRATQPAADLTAADRFVFRRNVEPLHFVREMHVQFHGRLRDAMTDYRQRLTFQGLSLISKCMPNLSRLCLVGMDLALSQLESFFEHCPKLVGLQAVLAGPEYTEMQPSSISDSQLIVQSLKQMQCLDLGQEDEIVIGPRGGHSTFLDLLVQSLGDNLRAIELSESLVTTEQMITLCKNCPNIIALDINSCENLDDELFTALPKLLPRLEALVIYPNWSLTNDGLMALCKDAHNLRVLDVDLAELDTAAAYSAFTRYLPRLQCISLGTCVHDDIQVLLRFLDAIGPRLLSLNLASSDVSDALLSHLTLSTPILHSLRLELLDHDSEDDAIMRQTDDPHTISRSALTETIERLPFLSALTLMTSQGDEVYPDILDGFHEVLSLNPVNSYFILGERYFNDFCSVRTT
ncbi:uncharacterized protein BJ171DRAFT_171513 [Polychytrium aggregatum]|uniref:uncharacterized protein n=1 Tax=Polychytrium aggregatum TaxID=110093 RepID=UPI0022FDB2F3|nr:uncharacterized protein BJ171DRAFT_254333 [Polychytrium aggregatum]XP_052971002.1 uncharacterized protein BJ171DRAFT_171513 [Polychytrium aggregatum]KAI9193532.1 hypothetical protein BJ171DRAFT_254333 [Polychytrium aggregatum]KAI9208922.1 hypothetical protein BJ171DRAFT_171513 [Polychytrium aggregatum]